METAIARGSNLDDVINPANPSQPISLFRSRMGATEARVCRIEAPEGTARGTGFLVGPRVVITNFHVLKELFADWTAPEKPWPPESVVARFDYLAAEDGLAVGKGTVFRLATDWLVDYSPYSPHDEEEVATGEPKEDEARLRVAAPRRRAGEVTDLTARAELARPKVGRGSSGGWHA